MVFVDTSAWFAYFFPLDAEHQQIKSAFQEASGPLLTTDYCIDETLTLLMTRGERRRSLEAGNAFFRDGICRIQFVMPGQIHRAWILFQQRAAAGWSFTDCTSKIAIDDCGASTALALDEHFHQFGNVAVKP